jgi:predicted RNA-binding Zn ribbon-like protein
MPTTTAARHAATAADALTVARRIFRLDNEHLAFRYTATLSDRAAAEPFERLSDPDRLRLWLAANGIDPARRPTRDQLSDAIALREAVYRVGAAVARAQPAHAQDRALVNAAAAASGAVPELTGDGMRWRLTGHDTVAAALGVIARDAVALLGGDRPGRIAMCDGPDCAGLYLDASRGGTRRWCSMNTCGNRNKKSRMRARG